MSPALAAEGGSSSPRRDFSAACLAPDECLPQAINHCEIPESASSLLRDLQHKSAFTARRKRHGLTRIRQRLKRSRIAIGEHHRFVEAVDGIAPDRKRVVL